MHSETFRQEKCIISIPLGIRLKLCIELEVVLVKVNYMGVNKILFTEAKKRNDGVFC